ncbi:MAG: NmrA family NAD(P)-binding protein [Rubrobacter sp.]|nr:NmrA family NAD(P)-binding protein [Rubrobacter sp.]
MRRRQRRTIDTLSAAFEGAYGAYCMTNFFEHFSASKETEQAENLARAAKTAGVRHAIWSTSPDSRDWVSPQGNRLPESPDGYQVPHWDGKARGNRYFSELGVPTTFLLPPTYWENLFMPGAPHQVQRGPDGVLAITLPAGEAKMPGMGVEDIGRCAYGLFKGGQEFVETTVGVAAESSTGAELAAAVSEALGENVRYNAVPLDVVRAAPFPGADAVANMFQIIGEANDDYCGHYDLALSRSINPQLRTLAEWVAANQHKFQVSGGAG